MLQLSARRLLNADFMASTGESGFSKALGRNETVRRAFGESRRVRYYHHKVKHFDSKAEKHLNFPRLRERERQRHEFLSARTELNMNDKHALR